MEKIILYDPSNATLNRGDEIISVSAQFQLRHLLENKYVVNISTHLPITKTYLRFIKNTKYRFVLGSNLLMGSLAHRFRQWDINIFNAKAVGPAILVGAGWWQYNNEPDFYTKQVYKKVLSNTFFHSVRDEYTLNMMGKMGFSNVINTGCPSTWGLSKEHCSNIPTNKGLNVVTTLTDYHADPEKDLLLLETLVRNYQTVYLWLQGSEDLSYFEHFESNLKNCIRVLPPLLDKYDDLLRESDSLDYVGTRLHAGLRALQHQRRSIIISVDNRAQEIAKDINIELIKRDEIQALEDKLNSKILTNIQIPEEKIKKFLNQFT